MNQTWSSSILVCGIYQGGGALYSFFTAIRYLECHNYFLINMIFVLLQCTVRPWMGNRIYGHLNKFFSNLKPFCLQKAWLYGIWPCHWEKKIVGGFWFQRWVTKKYNNYGDLLEQWWWESILDFNFLPTNLDPTHGSHTEIWRDRS